MAAAIQSLASRVIESKEHANELVDLMQHLERDTPTAIAATEGLSKVFCHYISHHYSWFAPQGCEGASRDNPVVKFGVWLKAKYQSTVERLLQLLEHPAMKSPALTALMSFVEAECRAASDDGRHITSSCFPIQLFSTILRAVLCSCHDNTLLISSTLSSYTHYSDVSFYSMKTMLKLMNTALRAKQKDYQWLPSNSFQMLQSLSLATSEDQLNVSLARPHHKTRPLERQDHVTTSLVSHKKLQDHVTSSLVSHKKLFSECWLTFLQIPSSSTILKRVLLTLHSSVMPNMVDPRLLLDFLIGAYDQGGVCGILSLNGLFLLMHQYHLDFPHFYDKLYQLLQPSVMDARYMPRFFYLLDVFMTSTHLPVYLVAAFIKRIARLCLTASPHGVMVGVVMVMNLLYRHPNCKVLLHRKDPNISQIMTDPYDMAQTDPSECNALESCLWELQALQCHYHPTVSSLVSYFINPDRKWTREEPLGQYLDMSTDQMFENELLRDGDAPPLQYMQPENGLWTLFQ